MPQIRITKELVATCQHKPNHKRRIVIAILLTLLAASIASLIAGCALEVRWAIILGILGIAFNVIALFISMDSMRKNYIQSRDETITIDHVKVIMDDEIMVSTVPQTARDIQVQRVI